jgi:hypothetical protein
MKAKNENKITNKNFPESLDPPLRELVGFLHQCGIKTTPSCAGHHKSEKNFRKIYSELKKDEVVIRKGKLGLSDIETGKKIFYHDKDYHLPWTEKDFLNGVVNYQRKGILGMRLKKNDARKKKLLRLKVEGVNVLPKGNIILLLMNRGTKSRWMKITKAVRKIFGEVKSTTKNNFSFSRVVPSEQT